MHKNIFVFCLIIILFISLAYAELETELASIRITKKQFHLFRSFVIDSDSLRIKNDSSFINTLKYSPLELQARSFPSAIQSDFSLRASNFEAVAILLDDRRFNDPQTAHHNSDIPLTSWDIERIDIYPTGNSSTFGPSAIGGAVNIITKKKLDREDVFELSTDNNRLKSILCSFSGLKPHNLITMKLSSEFKESDGFYYDTEFKKYTFNIDNRLDLSLVNIDIFLGYQEKEFGAYDFYTPYKGYPSFEWTKTYLVNFNLDYGLENFSLRQGVLWRRHYDKFLLDKTRIRSRYLNHHYTDLFSPLFSLKISEPAGGISMLNFEYTDESIISTNLGKHQRVYPSLFVERRNDFNRFSYNISYRIDTLNNRKNIYTGAINLGYVLNEERRIILGFNRSMRLPSFTELYYNDPTTEGNINLLPEEAYKYDLGYEHLNKEKKFLSSVCIFLRNEKKTIDWVKENFYELKWRAKNIGVNLIRGIEVRIKKEDIKDFLKQDLFYTYVDRKSKTKQNIYKYGLNYSRHRFFWILEFNLNKFNYLIGINYNKSPHRDGWFLIDTDFIYKPHKKNTEIFLQLSNLLNVEYQQIPGIPSPKRIFKLGMRIRR